MAVGAVELLPRRETSGCDTNPDVCPFTCSVEAVAQVLSRLLHREILPAEVRDRAVGLGLLRMSESGCPTHLTATAVSRLFLAGYRLPAHVELPAPERLRAHLESGQHVFLLVPGPKVFDVPGLLLRIAARDEVILAELGAPAPRFEAVCLDWLAGAWAGATYGLVVAARQWCDLSAAGATFFGGMRQRDGTICWTTADCDTDAEGRVLRC
jgi:hypothetical protein